MNHRRTMVCDLNYVTSRYESQWNLRRIKFNVVITAWARKSLRVDGRFKEGENDINSHTDKITEENDFLEINSML